MLEANFGHEPLDCASYIDDNTPYAIGNGVNNSLKEAADELFCWFADNQMKTNPQVSFINM